AEGDVMRAWMLEKGVRPEDVIAETKSFNTRENLGYAKEIMEEQGLSQALVVTSDYHVARALALCRQVGIEATGKGSPSKPEYFIKNHIREGLSWIKFALESML
ncbi:MAG: YdcF family protein, partial [Kiritimatiellae bacterium]|nr:YdcF family protein [Kiritimatiellia bacterium]